MESKVDAIEISIQKPTTEVRDLADQIEATRKEMRQFPLTTNDNEQYSQRNKLHIKGLNVDDTDDNINRNAVVGCIRSTLRLPIDDAELAHPLPVRADVSTASSSSSSQTVTAGTAGSNKAVILVRF
jgi:hypothetical protein